MRRPKAWKAEEQSTLIDSIAFTILSQISIIRFSSKQMHMFDQPD